MMESVEETKQVEEMNTEPSAPPAPGAASGANIALISTDEMLSQLSRASISRNAPVFRIAAGGFEISVGTPETRGGINKYLMYPIQGKDSTGATFSTFRRFKDFCWLHEYLLKQFPGTFIPPLPPKKSVGNFDDEFVQLRRTLLERFLVCISSSPHLSSSTVFLAFLHRSEGSFELAKKDYSSTEPSRDDIVKQYQQFFADYIARPLPEDMDSTITKMKDYLKLAEVNMKSLQSSLLSIASGYQSLFELKTKLPKVLIEMASTEAKIKDSNEYISKFPRMDSSSFFDRYTEKLKERRPELAYQAMAGIASVEIMDIEAMRQVLADKEDAQSSYTKCVDKVNDLTNQIDKLKRGARGNIISGIFGGKSKEDTLAGLETSLEQAKKDEENSKILLDYINHLIVFREFDNFRSSCVARFATSVKQFAETQIFDHQQVDQIWSQLLQSIPEEAN